MEIRTSRFELRTEDGSMPVFRAEPQEGGRWPAVVVLMEAFGLNRHIESVAERLAREGYVTAAPDLYYREETRSAGYDQLDRALALMGTLDDEKVVRDLEALVSSLAGDPKVDGDRIGVTGFCMGGRIAFLVACRDSRIRAAVPFYGGGITASRSGTGKAPLDYAPELRSPMLLFFGGRDPFIPLDEVERIRARLSELGKDAEVVVYPDAPHGFFCDDRNTYRPDAAADAWRRMLEFFAKHLGARPGG
ncbi:MAG: carboxymethylenebutenolidase [Candidatus Binatia bacterium]|nr:MAG: carboxymethylenebutenolidase [Candidatus Binatia bacterium]